MQAYDTQFLSRIRDFDSSLPTTQGMCCGQNYGVVQSLSLLLFHFSQQFLLGNNFSLSKRLGDYGQDGRRNVSGHVLV
jgi:hypothetical protein